MLKARRRKYKAHRNLQDRTGSILLDQLFKSLFETQEREFNNKLAEKLIKQSEYEKETAFKLSQIEYQKKVFIDHAKEIQCSMDQTCLSVESTHPFLIEYTEDEGDEDDKMKLAELHRRLYDEKVKRKEEEHRMMCLETVEDVVDFAVKESQLRSETDASVPRRTLNEWKALFYKALPLFEAVSDEDLLQYMEREIVRSEEDPRPYEEIELDVMRANAIMTLKLENYFLMLGEWRVEFWPELADQEEVQNVLGYIVHRLLEFKYPLPEPIPPADIPRYPVASVLNGINDSAVLNKLQCLLDKSGVALIDVNKAVNHVVREYRATTLPGEIEESFKKKDKKRTLRKSSSVSKRKRVGSSHVVESYGRDVMVQVPEETETEPVPVTLGKEVVKILAEGGLLPDPLLVDVLIEYIKSLKDINGWVLLNYPFVCSQVAILEFKLNGVEAPILCKLDDSVKEFIESHSVRASEELMTSRTSRLVPRPNEQHILPKFKTHFTSYVALSKEDISVRGSDERKTSMNEDLVPPEEEVDELAAFYEKAGIYTLFTYRSLDVEALKKLARIILNEDELDENLRQPSIELFGREALEHLGLKKHIAYRRETDYRSSGQRKTFRKDKRSSSGNKKSFEEVPPVEDPIRQDPDVPPEGAFLPPPEINIIPPPKPGQLDWKYSNLPIPRQVLLLLADLWDCIESNYINNIKLILYHHKVQNQMIMPYRNYVRTVMRELIEAGDSRQDSVNEFQDWFNNVHEDMRSFPEMKAELHCRVFEFQNSLWRFCDDKKNAAESKRQEIVRKNWLADQMNIICNIYLCLVQIEIDRFIETVKLIQLYYLASLSKPLDQKYVPNIEVPRLRRPGSDNDSFKGKESDLNPTSSTRTFSKPGSSMSYISNQPRAPSLNQSIISLGSPKDNLSYTNVSRPKQGITTSKSPSWAGICENPINEEGESEEGYHCSLIRLLLNAHSANPETATSFHLELTDIIQVLSEKVSNARLKIKNKTDEIKDKERKMTGKVSKRSSRNSTKSLKSRYSKQSDISSKRASLEDEVLNPIREWETAVNNETERCLFRLKLIRCRALEDLNEAQSIMVDTFKNVYEDILDQYNNGIANIDMMCNVFKAAIEEELPIQSKLMLDLDRFYVLKDVLVFPPTEPPPPTPITYVQDRFIFSIEQLRNLAELMKRVSPVGIIKASFVSILHDIALFGGEEGRPCLPKSWSRISHQDLENLMDITNGPAPFVDWKDFLVQASNVPFPTVQELIEVREEFRSYDPNCTETISREDYQKIQFWFEKDLSPSLYEAHRMLSAKELFFDLFETEKDKTNYTALLLAFCKDEDPAEGFGKALSLMTGYGYILSDDRAYLEELGVFHEEAETIGKQVMLQLIWDVMEITEGVVITELEEEVSLGSFASEGKVLYQTEDLLEEKSVRSWDEWEGCEEEEGGRWEFEEKEESLLSIKDNVTWKSMVPYNLAFTLLYISLHLYALDADQLPYQISLETLLKRAYKEKGQYGLIKASDLIKTDCMKYVFDQSYRFRIVDVCAVAQDILSRMVLTSSNL
jgi:adenylate kinase family enzyme